MIRANIQAQIESQAVKLNDVERDIMRLGRLIDGLKEQQSNLLSRRSDIIWKIEELKEELEDETN